MLKIIFKLLFFQCLLSTFVVFSQVGIGTHSSQVSLALIDDGNGLDRIDQNRLAIKTNGLERIHIDNNGFVGINMPNPTKILDINAENSPIRIQQLGVQTASTNEYLVIDPNTGFVGKTLFETPAGQIIRIGFNANGNTNGDVPNPNGEWPLRFNFHKNESDMGNSLAGISNYINTINGSSLLTDQNIVTAGIGTPSRITDQIHLPIGVYKIYLRFSGRFEQSDIHNKLDIKLVVNNNEYAYTSGIISGQGTAEKVGYFSDTVVIKEPSTIDFIYVRQTGNTGGNFIFPSQRAGSGGNSYRNLIFIERLE